MELPHNDNSSLETSAQDQETSKNRLLGRRGMRCVVAGSVLLVVSFLVNFAFFHAGWDFSSAMFVMTTGGSVLLLVGIALLFGL